MHLDASFHHGIDSFVFCSRAMDPPLSFLRKPFVPLYFGFRVSLLSHLVSTRAGRAEGERHGFG
jgi:hypothetical protein